MYYEVWIDPSKKEEVERKLRERCDEVYEVFYDYHYIVRVSDEKKLNFEGVRFYRRHYNC
jgi:hypothetical protein